MKKKYVLVNKRRFIIIISVLVSIILSTLIIATTHTKGYSIPEYSTIVVESGDTLWDIACENYGNDIDIRKMVSEIRKANGMNTSELSVGQVLLIPVR